MLAIAHNGVIENFAELANVSLKHKGFDFDSETDTEVIAHLIAESPSKRGCRQSDNGPRCDQDVAIEAIKDAIAQLRGTFGLAIIFKQWPDAIFAASLGSPLVIGIGDGEHFLASDASPLVGYTDRIVYLADHQVAMITADSASGFASGSGCDRARRATARTLIETSRTRGIRALHAQGDI